MRVGGLVFENLIEILDTHRSLEFPFDKPTFADVQRGGHSIEHVAHQILLGGASGAHFHVDIKTRARDERRQAQAACQRQDIDVDALDGSDIGLIIIKTNAICYPFEEGIEKAGARRQPFDTCREAEAVLEEAGVSLPARRVRRVA